MDPDEALRMIRELIVAHAARGAEMSGTEEHDWAVEVREHVEALDEWLSKGGFLPHAWQAKTDPPRLADPLGPPNPAHGELPDEEDGHGLDWRQAPAAVDGVTGRCDCGVSFGSAQTVRELVDRYEEHIRAAGVPDFRVPDVADPAEIFPIDYIDYCGAYGCGDTVVTPWVGDSCGCCGRVWAQEATPANVCRGKHIEGDVWWKLLDAREEGNED